MTQPPRNPRLRLPAFHPVPVRARADGWTPMRQAEFIGVLAETGSVRAAAEFVGMARETAYRRKPEAEEFAHAWDVALVIAGVRRPGEGMQTRPPRKVTPGASWRQVVDGNWRPVIRRGKYAGSIHTAEQSALLRFLAQLDRAHREGLKELRAQVRSQTQKRASGSTGKAG